MREAKRATLSRAEVLAHEVVMLQRNRAPGWQTDTGESLEEFGLAVAGNTGDADDLARAKVEADAFDPGYTQAIADFEVAHGEECGTGLGEFFFRRGAARRARPFFPRAPAAMWWRWPLRRR